MIYLSLKMGIEGFQPWLRKQYEVYVKRKFEEILPVISTDKKKKVRNLDIDFNALVHNAVNIAYSTPDPKELEDMFANPNDYWLSPGGVLDTLQNELVEILAIVQPEKLLNLAADGVVNKAKMLQQRQRSFASSRGQGEKRGEPSDGSSKAQRGEPFNRNNIKPGTEFMLTMANELRKRILNLGWSQAKGFPFNVEFSDASQPGEGEHKIMARMRKEPPKKSDFDHRNYVDVIYSSDSDMSLLAMMHSAKNMTTIIMRQAHSFDHTKDQSEENYKYEYYNITAIRNAIEESGFKEIRDFVLITCFAGNDFMPGLAFTKRDRTLVFNTLTSTYFKVFGRNSATGNLMKDAVTINWGNLSRYLAKLVSTSEFLLEGLATWHKSNLKSLVNEETGEDRSWPLLSKCLTTPDAEASISARERQERTGFDYVYFSRLYRNYVSGIFVNPNTAEELTEGENLESELKFDVMPEMTKKYLEALIWVMTYYETQGSQVNSDWCYNFHYAPDIFELDRYLARYHHSPFWLKEPLNPNRALNSPVEHLLSILHHDDLDLVPVVARALFLEKMPSLFPDRVQIDYTLIPFTESSHKAVVMINYPDLNKIRKLFDSIRDDNNIKGRNNLNPKTKIWPTSSKPPKKFR